MPIPTGTPAMRRAGTGQTPEPRIMLATGLWTTVTPARARSAISAWPTQMQWAASSGTSSSPTSAARPTVVSPHRNGQTSRYGTARPSASVPAAARLGLFLSAAEGELAS